MPYDYTHRDLKKDDTIVVIVFQKPTLGRILYTGSDYIRYEIPHMSDHVNTATGILDMIVKVPHFPIIGSGEHKDAIGRDIDPGDSVVIRKGARFTDHGIIERFTSDYAVVNGKRKLCKFLVKVPAVTRQRSD